MEGKEEDVRVGANKFPERQPIGTSAQTDKDYKEPPPAPFFEPGELSSWSFYRAGIAEFIATFLFLYITVLTVMGVKRAPNMCASVGIQGIAWAFGGMIFALVYCTAGISGNPIFFIFLIQVELVFCCMLQTLVALLLVFDFSQRDLNLELILMSVCVFHRWAHKPSGDIWSVLGS